MDEVNIDIRNQRSKATKEYVGRMFFRYVITVCSHADQNCPQALWVQSGVKLHWPFDDPAAVESSDEEKLAAFRRVRDEIEARIKNWIGELGLPV